METDSITYPYEVFNIPLSLIDIPEDRQREDLGDIESFALGIAHFGLLHPIVIEPSTNGRFTLVTGERRYRAFASLEKETIPAVLRSGLDELDRKELEFEENIRRKDLSWIELIRAEAALHELKQKKYSNLPGRLSAWTAAETARELNISPSKLSLDLSLVSNLDRFPQLQEQRTKKEALYLLSKLESGGAISEDVGIQIIRESVFAEEFSTTGLRSQSCDLLIADLSGCSYKAFLCDLHYLKPTAHAFIFFPFEDLTFLCSLLAERKVNFLKKPLIWHKKKEDDYETFLWFSIGMAQPPKDLSFHFSHRQDADVPHPKAKPYWLYYTLLTNTTHKGGLVFHPFCYDLSLVRVCVDQTRNVRAWVGDKVLYDKLFLSLKIERTGRKNARDNTQHIVNETSREISA